MKIVKNIDLSLKEKSYRMKEHHTNMTELPVSSRYVRWIDEDHGDIYEAKEKEEWKRTLEEMDDEHWEEKTDDIDKLKALEKVQRNIKLHFLKEQLKEIQNKTPPPITRKPPAEV